MRITTLSGAVRAIAVVAVMGGMMLSGPAIAAARSHAPPRRAPSHHVSAAFATHRAHVAASGCTSAGPRVTDFRGIHYETRYCHNYRGGSLRLYSGHSGYLNAGTNWFVCQQRFGENPRVGNARNNIWLYTQGDVSYGHHGWGWLPATYVSGGTNYGPIPGLRWC